MKYDVVILPIGWTHYSQQISKSTNKICIRPTTYPKLKKRIHTNHHWLDPCSGQALNALKNNVVNWTPEWQEQIYQIDAIYSNIGHYKLSSINKTAIKHLPIWFFIWLNYWMKKILQEQWTVVHNTHISI